jgi:glycosyltransferase involved in cell wall biosynthesis
VGVLTPQKGHEHLIDAAGLLDGRGVENVPVRLIGAPSEAHPEYVQGLRDHAAALNRKGTDVSSTDPGSDVPLLVQGVDVFVLASVGRSEGMPTAILEAMVAGKPVVATDVGAVRELVADGETGILVPPADPVALADAIGELVSDEEKRQRMGEAGRSRALREFSLGELARRHAGAYDAAVAHRRGA